MDLEVKKPKILVEKIEILDESTGQIILKEQARLVYTNSKNDQDQSDPRDSIIIEDFDDATSLNLNPKSNSLDTVSTDIDYTSNTTIQLFDESNNNLDSLETLGKNSGIENAQRIIIIEATNQSPSRQVQTYENSISSSSATKKNLINSGLSAQIVQNYSILASEITAPLEPHGHKSSQSSDASPSSILTSDLFSTTRTQQKWKNTSTKNSKKEETVKNLVSTSGSYRAQKDMATCQFCGRAMLKKNIPTHIRRAHTPKEELVCLNEEQNIFTFQHLKPGQRRKRSARAYDYSLMTATVSIDEDPCDGIENKFITEGEEILSTDLLQLADRIKYGISQIPNSTLTKLIDILSKIEYNTQDEISANAKSIRNMICFYLTSGEEFKYKVRQVGDDIVEKKKQVNNLRADLKEIMARKAQLERRIQPLICELQKLEDQHGNLIESILKSSDDMQFEILTNDTNESV